MTFTSLIFLHSFFRWILLLSLIYAVFRGIKSWFGDKSFTQTDNMLRQYTASLSHLQLLIGVWLYFISPSISYFLSNFKEAVHIKNIRFFAMEHSLMMVIAILIVTVGSIVTKRMKTPEGKIKSQVIFFGLALLIIFVSIPWPFLSFSVPRPYFRGF